MFVVLLKFSNNRDKASQFMDAHRAWIKQGLEEGTFLLVGSLQPNMGGAILAHNTSREDLEARLNNDPFVAEDVARPEVLEITPAMADERFKFLVD